MSKVLAMLLALLAFCAVPAVAFAQEEEEVASDNEQEAEVDQDASSGGSGDNGDNGSGGGSAGNQAAICQQNAGEDAVCTIDQSQFFGGDRFVHEGEGNGDENGEGGGHVTVGGVGGGGVGGGVQGVRLAVTGFDAWVLALIGGLSLAGGIGLLAAQRRGRLGS